MTSLYNLGLEINSNHFLISTFILLYHMFFLSFTLQDSFGLLFWNLKEACNRYVIEMNIFFMSDFIDILLHI